MPPQPSPRLPRSNFTVASPRGRSRSPGESPPVAFASREGGEREAGSLEAWFRALQSRYPNEGDPRMSAAGILLVASRDTSYGEIEGVLRKGVEAGVWIFAFALQGDAAGEDLQALRMYATLEEKRIPSARMKSGTVRLRMAGKEPVYETEGKDPMDEKALLEFLTSPAKAKTYFDPDPEPDVPLQSVLWWFAVSSRARGSALRPDQHVVFELILRKKGEAGKTK